MIKQYLNALGKFLKVENEKELNEVFALFPEQVRLRENDPMFFYHQDRWFLAVQMLEYWAESNNWFYDVEDQVIAEVFDYLPEHFAIGVEDDMPEKDKKIWLNELNRIYQLALNNFK